MIRKGEADMIPLSPAHFAGSSAFVAVAKTVYCSSGYDILNIDISHYGEVVARYFADKVEGKFKGCLIGKKWKKIKFENLIREAAGQEPCVQTYGWGCGYTTVNWSWNDKKNGKGKSSKEVVGKFLRSTRCTELIFWENAIESETYYSRQKSRFDRLQERINALLGPAPDGFEEWAERLTDGPRADLCKVLDDLGKHIYRCTECGEVWERKRRYRNKRIIKCPHCGAEIEVDNYFNSQNKHYWIYLFGMCRDGTERWYERYIEAHRRYDFEEKKWRTVLDDQVLAVIDKGAQWGTVYYRDGAGYDTTRHYGTSLRFRKGYIFPDFDGADNLMNSQQARCLRPLADRGIEIDANKVITMSKNPGLEYLIKGRYDRLVKDSFTHNAFEGSRYYKHGARSLTEYMKLDKQRCNRLRQINGSLKEMEWLQYEQMTGRKVSAEDLGYFMKHGVSPNETFYGTRLMLSYIPSPLAFKHYLEKQSAMSGMTVPQTISEYNDYIRMAKNQGLNLSSEIFFKPKNLKAAHDECVRVAHAKEYENRAKEIVKKFPEVPEILKAIRPKYTFESGEFAIIVPEKIEDIIAEGRALGHCIDTTDRYFDRIQNHVTYLVFLRHSAARNQSWYTLEIEPGGTVRQQRTTGNRQDKADTEAYMPFVREWQKVIRQRISEEDKAAAVRSREMRLAEYKELREKKETVRNGLLAGQLLVDVLEADLVEAM